MKMIKILTLAAFVCVTGINAQTITNPNFAMKSHETLGIVKVETTPQKTVVYLSIENRITGGSFCTDRNTDIIYPDGSRMKMVSAEGIPLCPDNYNFKEIGEKLMFTLSFPPVRSGTKWIDIVEDCSDNCFWFYGVTLDNELNSRLEKAFEAAGKGTPGNNIMIFRSILEEIDDSNLGIEGLLYINIINDAIEAGNQVEASVWYKRLAASGAPRRSYYLKYLNDKGIKY